MQPGFESFQSHLINCEFTVTMASVIDQVCVDFLILGPLASFDDLLRLSLGCFDTLYLNNLHILVKWGDVQSLLSQPITLNVLQIVRRLNEFEIWQLTSCLIPVKL